MRRANTTHRPDTPTTVAAAIIDQRGKSSLDEEESDCTTPKKPKPMDDRELPLCPTREPHDDKKSAQAGKTVDAVASRSGSAFEIASAIAETFFTDSRPPPFLPNANTTLGANRSSLSSACTLVFAPSCSLRRSRRNAALFFAARLRCDIELPPACVALSGTAYATLDGIETRLMRVKSLGLTDRRDATHDSNRKSSAGDCSRSGAEPPPMDIRISRELGGGASSISGHALVLGVGVGLVETETVRETLILCVVEAETLLDVVGDSVVVAKTDMERVCDAVTLEDGVRVEVRLAESVRDADKEADFVE